MAGVRALLRTPRPSLSPRRLRQAGNGIVRPRGDLPDARGAHGRHRRGDDRQRDGSRHCSDPRRGGALGALRGDLPGAGGRPRHVRRVRQGRRRSGLALWSGGGRGVGESACSKVGARPRGPGTSPSIGAEDLRDDPAFIAWLAKLLRFSATPTAAVAFGRVWDETDVRDILPSVGRRPCSCIAGPTTRSAPRSSTPPACSRSRASWSCRPITGPVHRRSRPDGRGDRVLPRRCRQLRGFPRSCARDGLLHRHRRLHAAGLRAGGPGLARARRTTSPAIRAQLARYRGVEVDTAGDGFFATFDGPARAVRCGQACVQAMVALGIEIRVGIHTGEVETIDGKRAASP